MDSVILQQYVTLTKLRFKLSLGSWQNHNPWVKAGYVLTGLMSGGLSLGMGVAFGYLMYFLFQYQTQLTRVLEIEYLWAITFGFVSVVWLLGPLMMSLQEDAFELHATKLLHYPISLRHVYLLNLGLGAVEPWSLFFYPIFFGVIIGTFWALGWTTLGAVVTLSFLFFLFHLVWSRLLQDFLAQLFAQRRLREVVSILMIFLIIVLAFVPALISQELEGTRFSQWINIQKMSDSAIFNALSLPLNLVIALTPVGHFALGLKALLNHQWQSYLLALVGLGAWGGLGLVFSNALFQKSLTSGPSLTVDNVPVRRFEWRLPGFPVWLEAFVLKELRSLLRSVLGKLCFFLTPVILVILRFVSLSADVSYGANAVLLGMSAYILMTTLVLFINMFGFDMDGFKNYLFLPVSATQVLMGKNIALILFTGIEFSVCLYLYIALYPLPELSQLLYAILSFLSSLTGALILGNFFSIRFPTLIDLNQPNQKRQSGSTLLALNFLSVVLFVPVMAMWIAFWTGESPLMIMGLFCLFLMVSYGLLFSYTARLLEEQMHEILLKVTKPQ